MNALPSSSPMDGANIGMVQRGGGFGFATEAAQGLRIPGEIVREKFQSDEAVEARILSLINDTHTTTADFFHYAVM